MLEVRGSDAIVAVGALKLTVPREVVGAEPATVQDTVGVWTGDLPGSARSHRDRPARHASRRGRGGVLQALDAAVRADLKSLRIIHGKGTGALRERVGEMLRKDTRVREFRLGAWNEGGAGVTVAEFA